MLVRRGQVPGPDRGPGTGPGELRDRGQQYLVGQLDGDAEAQQPATGHRVSGHRGDGPVVAREDGPGLGEQGHPRVGGPDAVATADEQRHAQFTFQRGDGL